MANLLIPEGCVVKYTYHGNKTKALFLTRSLAEDYIQRLKLSDAIIKNLYSEDQCEFDVVENEVCTAKQLDVSTELVADDGVQDTGCARIVQINKQGV